LVGPVEEVVRTTLFSKVAVGRASSEFGTQICIVLFLKATITLLRVQVVPNDLQDSFLLDDQ
jgi:hypothetical protein